ncbi:MAG: hypothetical protein JKY95_04750 [Planctomycetaceae bacterium]|nr:hypothetical protein [Planctomycetaceae bacterium]
MLKVNVGLSRKVSKDYNSTGFSLNLEGEVCVPLDDPEMVIEKIKELYDLAEESLDQQVARYEEHSAIATRDAAPPSRPAPAPQRSSGTDRTTRNSSRLTQPRTGNGHTRNSNGGDFSAATNKQIQYLLTLGKRLGLTTPQLEQRVGQIVGREVGLYDLTKDEAGIVLDELTAEGKANTPQR